MPTVAETITEPMMAGTEISGGPFEDAVDQDRAATAQEDADGAAAQAEDDGFDQELKKDVLAASAHGHTQADLARASVTLTSMMS